MSLSRNADESLHHFAQARGAYERSRRHLLESLKGDLLADLTDAALPLVDEALEAHVRVYIVDALLDALNWRQHTEPGGPEANLVIEASIRSLETGTRRFLDYLGLDTDERHALLIVETKRPSARLPRIRQKANPAATFADAISLGLRGSALDGDWDDWLHTLRDYYTSTIQKGLGAARRVVITNGDWLVLFLDPEDALLQGGAVDRTKILVWEDRAELELRYPELYRELEHGSLLKRSGAVPPEEVRLYIAPEAVRRSIRGVRLVYDAVPGVYDRSRTKPLVSVAPVLFLKSRYGPWVLVERESELSVDQLPPHEEHLSAHLTEVERRAEALLKDAEQSLARSLQPSSLEDHYADTDSFSLLPGVQRVDAATGIDPEQYLVVTGQHAHYMVPEPSVANCPYHDWAACAKEDRAEDVPILRSRTTPPRAFFVSQDLHHCAHDTVLAIKRIELHPSVRDACGTRSGEDGQAFCEIARFEEHLCCRTCVFAPVCSKAQFFKLPCRSGVVQPDVSPAASACPSGPS